MRKAVPAAAAVAGLAAWIALYPGDWQNWLGFSKAAYFTDGQNYAFASGIGPMLLTAIGLSTLITGLWHAHNCHAGGCLRVGRHKVDGTPFCARHHESARPAETEAQKLDRIAGRLDELVELARRPLAVPPPRAARRGPDKPPAR